ncbi:hypothetical protein BCR25_09595 [Enterococcus termitis]|uniref:Uncharacterized protein n=3 Tax=Enterococcus termitis TaxID=332950 RepID=A0A1E5GBD5_9ENTE|nr:hypothetical protein BCR25_09595 [Enterococcus termitis]
MITGVIVFLGIIGVLGVKKKAEPSIKEKQLAFLKKRENEMTDFIKNQDDKISKVYYDWSTLDDEVVENGLPQGGDDILTLRIKVIDYHDTDINSFGFAVSPDNINDPVKIKDMYTINADYNYSKENI